MLRRMTDWLGRIAAVALLLASAALAADAPKATPSEPTPETRQKMAEIHQNMAECLRSERPLAECRAEMGKSCQDMMAGAGCPMLEDMGPGMMGGGMMQGAPASKPKKN
jgi:hypothetical protein